MKRPQLYTVKRIPGERPTDHLFEILGPGAPAKPIASEAIATMLCDALEAATTAVLENVDSAVDELGFFDVTVYDDELKRVVIRSENPGERIYAPGSCFTAALRQAKWRRA